ncbi:GNAT family N-acetyltransferase [Nocardioides pelophilus]|uniref:GNAT family N-acetyltransferase n=1 Tax=Nocardioides pelophilus TaxID=2172019 RepID=UPI001603A6E5|nr:GNAT family N-acetyltransferase [Nocardioides pelophilus]
MVLPEVVDTARLRLPLWDAATVAAVRAGQRLGGWHPSFPRDDDVDAAGLWQEGVVWGPRSIVVDGEVVGSLGFFGPPVPADDGIVETEVGYGLVEEARGRGIATEALAALLAFCDTAGVRIRASIAPDNAPSLAVAARTGFTEIRGTNEDGELVLVRPAAPVHHGM